MIPHPRDILMPQATALIRNYAFAAEQKGRLTDEVLDWLQQEQALRILIPEDCGGLEWPLPKVVAYFEALAWADGNLGWLVNLGAGANMFAGYFDRLTARQLFTDKRIWCAGSGANSGKAVRVDGGYRITGRWKYASGSAHATHFTANAVLVGPGDRDDSADLSPDSAAPDFRSFIFRRADVQVLDSWQVTGLCATSSNDFAVSDLFVPDAHVFSLVEPSTFAHGPLYRFPFETLAVVNMACMPTGLALHFIDLFAELIAEKKPLHRTNPLKDDPLLKTIFAETVDSFLAARTQMFMVLKQVWMRYEQQEVVEQQLLMHLTMAARHAVAEARSLICQLYSFGGMNMVFTRSPLNKVWRDFAVASQHYLLSPLNL